MIIMYPKLKTVELKKHPCFDPHRARDSYPCSLKFGNKRPEGHPASFDARLLDRSTSYINNMADEEVATKAPESDAAEKSVVPGDTPAQEGPTMGVCCAVQAAILGRAQS